MSHQIWESRQINICQLLGWEHAIQPLSWRFFGLQKIWQSQPGKLPSGPINGGVNDDKVPRYHVYSKWHTTVLYIYIYVIYICYIYANVKKPCAYKIIHGTHATQTTGLTKSPIDPMDTTSKSFPKSPYINDIMHNKNHNDNDNCQFSLEPCTPCLFTHHWSPYRASRARLPQTTAMIGMKGCSSLR